MAATTYAYCSPAAWTLLMSPVRVEIAEALRLLGEASVADIAATLDRPADTLYRHLAALQEAGLVDDAGLRKTGRNAEQVFKLAAEDFRPDFSRSSKATLNRVVHRAAASLLKATERTIRDAGAAHEIEPGNLAMGYELGWLTPARFQAVQGLVQQIKALMDEGKTKRDGRLYLTMAVACPVVRKRGARSPSAVTPRAASGTDKTRRAKKKTAA